MDVLKNPPFRTATKVSEMLGNVNTSSALSAFEKMEEKGIISLTIT
jgi:phage shock protein A